MALDGAGLSISPILNTIVCARAAKRYTRQQTNGPSPTTSSRATSDRRIQSKTIEHVKRQNERKNVPKFEKELLTNFELNGVEKVFMFTLFST